MSGGLAFEAMNNIGHQKKQFLLVLNDNDMSISPNVGAFRNYLLKISTNRYYNVVRSRFTKLLTKFPKLLQSFFYKAEKSIKSFFLPVTIFEELGFRYFGPVDGHNVEELVSVFKKIKNINSPVVLHAITKKGKGIDYAEKDPVKFHGVKQKETKSSSPSIIYQNVFGKEILRLAKDNNDIIAITAAMKEGTGLVEFAENYPDRFFDVGIAEAHAVTFAGALAANGKIPIVAIYSTFLQRAFDQIIHDIALQKLSVIFCLDRSGLVGEDGATHHGVLDISYLKCIPGMTVASPKDGNELKNLLYSATTYNEGPISIRYPKDNSIIYTSDIPILIPKGSWEVLMKGEDFVILAVGSMVYKSVDIAKEFQTKGFNIEVVNCRFIKPLDEEYLKIAKKKFRKIITIEEGNLDGGFCESILSHFSSSNSDIDILTLGLPNSFVDHGTRDELLEKVGLDTDSIKSKIESFIIQ
jgi:1-deoxy-D-xylulose-5-phosphate synthase